MSKGIAELPRPLAAIAISPWIDLSLSGRSIETRAKADPLLTRDALAGAAGLYLGDHDPGDPRVCALAAPNGGLPPVQIHVGDDEILLNDATRYAEPVKRNEGEVALHVWKGMTHVFPSGLGFVAAADEALDLMTAFVRAQTVEQTD